MHSPQILQPDNLIKLANRIGETLFCREVIPGRKGVCCIKTDTYPLFFIYLFNDFSQVLKPVAHIGALAGGILNDCHHLFRILNRQINGLCNHSEAITLRSEEHTSELQSRGHLVCRLLLEKTKDTADSSY